jgi:hypothetical protein
MPEIDRIVTRYMDDREFGVAAFDGNSRAIFNSIFATTEAGDQ